MEDPPHLFNYGLQDGEDDGRYQMFGSAYGGAQQNYSQAFSSSAFPDDLSPPIIQSGKAIRPAHDSISSMGSRPSLQLGGSDFSFTAGLSNQTGRLPFPPVREGVKLESPGLSSGSSSTPETAFSSQSITPENHPAHSQQSHGLSQAVFPPPMTALPPRKRRPRKPKPRPHLSMEQEEVKRNKFLERNRVAATKCRQKRKEWQSDLEETKFGLESQNSHLQMEYSGLVNEVSQIRAQLMSHANCHDPNIDKWIENEAKRFVLGSGERYDAMLANVGQVTPGEVDHRHGSLSSASGYTTSNNNEGNSPNMFRGSLSSQQSAGLPSSPVAYRGRMASMSGYPTASNDSFISPMTRRASLPQPPQYAAPGSSAMFFRGGMSGPSDGQHVSAGQTSSYGLVQTTQEGGSSDYNHLSFAHGML